jgi:hypothetical protein
MRKLGAIRVKISAISLLLALFFVLIFSPSGFAGTPVGKVSQLNGPLFAKKADATILVLSVNSAVEDGDTLVTEKKTYARIRFSDDSELILRPNSQLRISQYHFDQASPKDDKAFFNLVKGGLRAVTGKIGARGARDSYKMITETAVAGVRGTTYEIRICEGNCGAIPDGLYLFVTDGTISVTNKAGSQDVRMGQYAYVANADTSPVILSENPGIDYTLPTSIEDSPKEGGTEKVDPGCVVR